MSWVSEFFRQAAKELDSKKGRYDRHFLNKIEEACNILSTYKAAAQADEATIAVLTENLKTVAVAVIGSYAFNASSGYVFNLLKTISEHAIFDETQKAEILATIQKQITKAIDVALHEGGTPAFFDINNSPTVGKAFYEFIIDQNVERIDEFWSVNPYYAIQTAIRHYLVFIREENFDRKVKRQADPRKSVFLNSIITHLKEWQEIPVVYGEREGDGDYFCWFPNWADNEGEQERAIAHVTWRHFMDLLIEKGIRPSLEEQIKNDATDEYRRKKLPLTVSGVIYETISTAESNDGRRQAIRMVRNYINDNFDRLLEADPYGMANLPLKITKRIGHSLRDRYEETDGRHFYRREMQGLMDDLAILFIQSDLAQDKRFTLNPNTFEKMATYSIKPKRVIALLEKAIERCETDAEVLGYEEYIKQMQEIAEELKGSFRKEEDCIGLDLREKVTDLRARILKNISSRLLEASSRAIDVCLGLAADTELDAKLRPQLLRHIITLTGRIAGNHPLQAIKTLDRVINISSTYDFDTIKRRARKLRHTIKLPKPLSRTELATIARFKAKAGLTPS